MLRLTDLTLSAGTRTLLQGAELHVRPSDRIGLIGRNGTGKSTLLKLMAGLVEADLGRVDRRGGLRIGYLPQQAVSGSVRSVWDETRSGATRRLGLEQAVREAEAALQRGEASAAARLSDATEAWRLGGGAQLDEQVGTVLHGLGFGPEAWTRPCDTFSGGWQMRIALARLLVGEHDLLLLDEPTNHLDAAARTWLADWLAESPAGLVIVSHDRWLLDRATKRTVELRHGRLEAFSGPLSAWLVERARRDEALETAAERQGAEIARLERFVERFGAKATKAAQAASRQKTLDKMERIEVVREGAGPRLVLPPPVHSAHEQLRLVGATLGHDGVAVLGGVSLEIERGQKWAFLGPNGAGKSTLLQTLAGRLPSIAGKRILGRDVRLAVYAQDLAQELPGDRTGLEHVVASVPGVTTLQARSALGALGLSGDAAMRPISALSGGEKARVVLAAFALRPASVLLLDEPTNHLDVETADVLAEALASWEGTVVLVTHDRSLVERVATHGAMVHDGRVEVLERILPEHFAPRVESRAKVVKAGDSRLESRERRRLQQQLERLFAKAEATEREITAIDEELYTVAADRTRSAELGRKRGEAEKRLEALFAEMSTLEAQLAEG